MCSSTVLSLAGDKIRPIRPAGYCRGGGGLCEGGGVGLTLYFFGFK